MAQVIATPPLSQSNPGLVTAGGYLATAGRHTQNIDYAANIPKAEYDISDRMYLLNGKAQPVLKIMQALEGQNATSGHNDTYDWYEDVTLPQVDELDGSLLDAATTIPVANPSKFPVNAEVALFDYNAQGYVTGYDTASVATATAIVVAWTHPPVVNIGPGALIMRIGNAQMQTDIHVNQPTTLHYQRDNTYQDLRHGVSASDQHIHGHFRVDRGDWDYQIGKLYEEQMRSIEKILLIGQQALVQTGDSPRGFTRGLWYSLASNQVDYLGAPLVRATWIADMLAIITQNLMPEQRWVWWSSTSVLQEIMNFAQANEITDTGATEFGLDFGVWKLAGGNRVYLKTHPLFDTHAPFSDKAILVNMTKANCGLRWHNCCPGTQKNKSVIPYGRTVREEFWRSVFTMYFKGEQINGQRYVNIG